VLDNNKACKSLFDLSLILFVGLVDSQSGGPYFPRAFFDSPRAFFDSKEWLEYEFHDARYE
jgi:hypothetical protein